jgi:hypothetical protein
MVNHRDCDVTNYSLNIFKACFTRDGLHLCHWQMQVFLFNDNVAFIMPV